MELIDLSDAARMLKAPHPLFGDDVDLQCVLWRRQGGELIGRRPPENKQKGEQGCYRPANLDFMTFALWHPPPRHGRATVIEREKDDDQSANQRYDEPGDYREQIE